MLRKVSKVQSALQQVLYFLFTLLSKDYISDPNLILVCVIHYHGNIITK